METYIRAVLRLLYSCLILSLLSVSARAQYENGSLVGTIHDTSGATVTGAALTVTNTATGIESKVVSDGSGNWEIPSLRVGVYRVTASMAGFNTAVADNIALSVGSRQRGQIITQYQSTALPLVSRNYSDFLALVTGSRQAPTAAMTSSVNSLVRAGAYNINGQRSMFNNFLLDGMDNNAYGESNQGFDNQIIAVPPDSVSQWQIVTNNENAEYGRSSGATINVASQAGTNDFHAMLYEFIRNTDLNAAGYFKPTLTGTLGPVPFQKPTFNRNQFGMNFGGPILKNKLFFFLDYEGFRQTLKPLGVFTLPTQNELTGKLVVPVQNPITGKTYAAGQQIPDGDFNPTSLQIVNFFRQIPLPQAGSPTTGLASNDYAQLVPFTDNSDKGD